MFHDHLSTRSRLTLMTQPNDPKLTLHRHVKMHETLFSTGHTDFNDDSEDTSAWVTLLKREGGEDGNGGIHPKTEQTEIPKMAKDKPHIDNVVPSYT